MPNLPELTAQLQSVEHFRNLPDADIRAIIGAGRVRRFAADETIFAESEPCAGMFVLLQGQVHLRKLGPQGQESILAIIEPVIMFNEVPVLDGGPNLVTAVAVTDCFTWQIGCEAFQALLQRYPQIGLGLLRVLARRNRFLVAQYEDISFRSVQARAAKLLLDLSDGGQRPIDRRKHPNHQMAARIATVPEAFSRALNGFKQRGAITCIRAEIIVSDAAALAALASQGMLRN
jgi:CRP/FNR family transcriptional regulator